VHGVGHGPGGSLQHRVVAFVAVGFPLALVQTCGAAAREARRDEDARGAGGKGHDAKRFSAVIDCCCFARVERDFEVVADIRVGRCEDECPESNGFVFPDGLAYVAVLWRRGRSSGDEVGRPVCTAIASPG
jgi:hypothetical protein